MRRPARASAGLAVRVHRLAHTHLCPRPVCGLWLWVPMWGGGDRSASWPRGPGHSGSPHGIVPVLPATHLPPETPV